MAGLTVLLLVGVAAALPFADLSCSARQPMGAQTEAMELRGRWLGMELAAAGSPSAVNAGIPPQVTGVVVMQATPQTAPRATQAGIATGDVIVRVDGTPVTTLAELYTLSTKLDVARPLPIDVSRRGQALSVTLPPPAGMPAPAGAPNIAATPPGIAAQPSPGMSPVMPNTGAAPQMAPQIGQSPQPQPVAQSAAWQAPMALAPNPAAPAPAAW
jgi:hypothetical protein